MTRGIRGATEIYENTRDGILEAARELVLSMVELNEIRVDMISHVIFTSTTDITAAFPASVLREMGRPWSLLPGLDFTQMPVDGADMGIIRALMVVETEKKPEEMVHPYLRGTHRLRPDRKILPEKD